MSLRTSNGNTISVQHQLARSGDVSYRDRRSRWGSTKVRDHLPMPIYSLNRLTLPSSPVTPLSCTLLHISQCKTLHILFG